MNRHPNADMIIAKAENLSLVVFHKLDGEWRETEFDWHDDFVFLSNYDYFLCLPQHKEACLHWLNGGEIEERGFYNDDGNFGEITIFGASNWNPNHIFMSDKSEFRIKTKKEKRWIAISFSRGISNTLYETLWQAKKDMSFADQYVEIEVEV